MKILIIGLGSIGQRHLRNIRQEYGGGLEIFAYRTRGLKRTISDTMKIEEGVDVESKYNLRIFTSIQEALSEKPDIAIISNITAKHIESAQLCAKAGCHLFIEKPLSNSLVGIEELRQIAREKNIVVFLGFQNRYHVCIKELNDILNTGKIGTVQSVSMEYGERITSIHTYEDYRNTYLANKKMGGGPIFNLQIHDLDLLYYFFGMPNRVYSVISKNSKLETDVEDEASSIYVFQNADGKEFPAYTHTDFFQYPPTHTIVVVGEIGRVEIDLINASLKLFVNGTIIKEVTYNNFKRNDMFVEELLDFFNCVRENTSATIGLDQGVASLKMAMGAIQSSQSKSQIIFTERND